MSEPLLEPLLEPVVLPPWQESVREALPLADSNLVFEEVDCCRLGEAPERRTLAELSPDLRARAERFAQVPPPFAGIEAAPPLIVGILNLTPDSFYAESRIGDCEIAVAAARAMHADGAHLLDLGGESTRPGAAPVGAAEEWRRLEPALVRLGEALPQVVLSVDTRKPELFAPAVRAGARVLNDVSGFVSPGALEAAAATEASLIVMHAQGEPQTMQDAPHYRDVVREVYAFFSERIAAAEALGVSRGRIALDPGIGFGKSARHNFELMRRLPVFCELGCRVLVGASRKSWISAASNQALDPSARLAGSLAGAAFAALRGAALLRVHDVAETRQALAAFACLARGEGASLGGATLAPASRAP